MVDSRKISDLLPVVQDKVNAWLKLCEDNGLNILITSTYRDNECQNKLYAQGRTTKGSIVTNAKGGQSMHNYQCALDFVPMSNGKPLWSDTKAFTKAGQLAEQAGFEWAGRWKSFRELAHIQYTNGLTLSDLQKGAKIV